MESTVVEKKPVHQGVLFLKWRSCWVYTVASKVTIEDDFNFSPGPGNIRVNGGGELYAAAHYLQYILKTNYPIMHSKVTYTTINWFAR